MELYELKNFLEYSYEKETCSPGFQEEWDDFNPTLGQCAVTALVVNDYFGGKIMRCMTTKGSHYYNIIDGEIVDFTVDQFMGEIPKYEEGEERTRDYLLSNEDTKNRYLLLLKNLRENVLEEERIREHRYRMCIKLRNEQRMDNEELEDNFDEILDSCSKQFYVNENGMILTKKRVD